MIKIVKTINNGSKRPKKATQIIGGTTYTVDQVKNALLEHLHEQTKALNKQCGWGLDKTEITTEQISVWENKTTITDTYEPVITFYSKFTETIEIISM